MTMNSEIIWTRCLVASFARRRAAGASGPDACPVRVLIRGAPPGVFPFESHDHEKIRVIAHASREKIVQVHGRGPAAVPVDYGLGAP